MWSSSPRTRTTSARRRSPWKPRARLQRASFCIQKARVTTSASDWRHDLDAMADRITDRTRIVFVCNPNNPTGTTVSAEEVRRFMDRVPDSVIVVFDEAYYEYVTSDDYPDTLRYIRDGRNIV